MAGWLDLPDDPEFWRTLVDVRGQMRDKTIQGIIDSAEQIRPANGWDADHPVTASVPPWVYDTLRSSDIERLSAQHAIEVKPAKRGA